MRNLYITTIVAALAAMMGLSASAQFKAFDKRYEQPAQRSIVTTAPNPALRYYKAGDLQESKVIKELTSSKGHKIAITSNVHDMPAAVAAAASQANVNVNLTFPAIEGANFLDVTAMLLEVGGWGSCPLFADEFYDNKLATPRPMDPGTYAMIIMTVAELGEYDFIPYIYEKEIVVEGEDLTLDIDLNDCVYSLNYEMARPDGSEFPWKTEDAPVANYNLVYGYNRFGVMSEWPIVAKVNECDANCTYTLEVGEISHTLPEAYAISSVMEGPFSEDLTYSITPDKYTKVSADITLCEADYEAGYRGVGFSVEKSTQQGGRGHSVAGRGPGEPYSHVDLYATMGETVVGDVEYVAQVGAVTGSNIKMSGRNMKIGDTWYIMQPDKLLVDGVWTYWSQIDLFNINTETQDVRNFAYTPWALSSFSIWVYEDDGELVIDDFGAEFDIHGPFHETINNINPFNFINELTIDGEDVDLDDMIYGPLPEGNMVATFRYDNLAVNGEIPTYVSATQAFDTYAEGNNPWISLFQIRCGGQITNNIDPALPSKMYLFGYGIGDFGAMNYDIDWRCEVAAEGTDNWIPVALDPQDTYTDYGAMCEIDLAALGLESNIWYKVRFRLANDDNNYTGLEMGYCFFMNEAGALTNPNIDGRVASTIFYDLSGRRVAEPGSGFYVRKSVMEDGRVVTDKVLR